MSQHAQQQEPKSKDKHARNVLGERINIAKSDLDIARRMGDKLRIELAENGLNALLDAYSNACNT